MNSLLKFYKGMKQWDCEKANGACNEPSENIEYEQFAHVLGIIIAFEIPNL